MVSFLALGWSLCFFSKPNYRQNAGVGGTLLKGGSFWSWLAQVCVPLCEGMQQLFPTAIFPLSGCY